MAAAAPAYSPTLVTHTMPRGGADGRVLRGGARPAWTRGDVKKPHSVCINHRLHHIIITDRGDRSVKIYGSDPPYDPITSWGRLGCREGEFSDPGHVTCDSEDRVIVCDEGRFRHRLQIFTALGDFITQIRCWRDGVWEYRPRCVCVDDDDNIYLGDLYDSTILVYEGSSGELMWRLGVQGPMGRFTIHSNRLYRCDRAYSEVHIHSLGPDCELITSVSLEGVIHHGMSGIDVCHDGRWIVTDRGHHTTTTLIHVVSVSDDGHVVGTPQHTFTYNGQVSDASILTRNTLVITDTLHGTVARTVELIGLSPPISPRGEPHQLRSLQSICRTVIRTSLGACGLEDVDMTLAGLLPIKLRSYVKLGYINPADD